jgi:hypothetical protein
MTTEHDLDTRLLAARGVHAEDLPALPEAFLDYLHTTGDEQPTAATARERVLNTVPAETPASVLAAQQLVADARQHRSGTTTPRRRRPTRRTVLRMGAAVLAVAAAWTTAVVVAPSEPPNGEIAAPSESPVSPDGGIQLVAAEQGHPDYWYTLGQLPEGHLFLLLAPLALTQEQVVQIADQVTYTP